MVGETPQLDLRRALRDPSLTTTEPGKSLLRIAVGVAAYVLLASLVVTQSSLLIRIPCWFAMSWLLLGHGAGVHEALHRHLFRTRWQNRVAGILMGATAMFPFHTHRAYHLEHHARAVSADDPEGAPYKMRTRWEYLLVPIGGVVFLLQMWWYALCGSAGRGPGWLRRSKPRTLMIDVVILLTVAGLAVWAATVSLSTTLVAWAIPWLGTFTVLAPLVLMPEHYAATLGDTNALTSATTIRSNRVLGWVYWWNNLHAVHHLSPAVTPHQMRAAQREADPFLVPDRESSGYLRWHARRLLESPR